MVRGKATAVKRVCTRNICLKHAKHGLTPVFACEAEYQVMTMKTNSSLDPCCQVRSWQNGDIYNW